ncbi:MAG: protease inhibitor I42 family protein [Coriobacteriia bacterium]
MRRVLVALALCVVVAAVGGCSSSDVVVGEDRSGDSVELAAGQVLVVELPGNPTTGYNWQVVDPPAVLKQQGELTYEPESDLVGAAGMVTLRFEGVEAGAGALTLEYARSWESTAALETYTLDVSVKD